MKTEQLIELLAQGTPPVDRRAMMWRLALAMVAGFFASLAMLILAVGLNPDFAMMLMNAWFWVRFMFIASITIIAAALFSRLGKPASANRVQLWPLVVPFIVLLVLACGLLLMAPPEERKEMLLGATWNVCARNISILAVPIFLVAIWIARQFAPVRLGLTGAMLGLFAGAGGALIYSLHCPEIEPAFVVVWYTLGMLIPAAVGAFLARWLLRW